LPNLDWQNEIWSKKMIIDKFKDLSFTEFYLIEFFKNTLDKGAGSIPEENYITLKELSNHLLAENNVVDGLEKLARYQGTSEFAIFLFDMVDRIQDMSPYTMFSSVKEQAEDFINLYQLMVEDSDSVSALESALELFREKSKVPREDKKIKVEESAEGELLSFKEFYQIEFDLKYLKILESTNLKDKKRAYTELISIFSDFNKTIDGNELKEYDLTVIDLADAVRILDIESALPQELMSSLDSNMEQCVKALRNLETKEQDLFLHITSTKSIPKQKPKKKEIISEVPKQLIETESKPEKIMESVVEEQTIDDVLHEYFKSEINVHLDQVKTYLNEYRSNPGFTILNKISEEFQALKEISMIHGYSGIEHFCASLISVLKSARKEKNYIGDESYPAFEDIFSEMMKIENYRAGSILSEDEQRNRIKQLCTTLIDTMTKTKPEVQDGEAVTKSKTDIIAEETGEELIAFSDKEKIYSILSEVYQKVHASFKGRLQLDSVLDTINLLISATKIVLPSFEKRVGVPLCEAYKLRDKLKNEDKKACGSVIDNIWNEIFLQINEYPNFTKLDQLFEEIKQIGTQKTFSFEDDNEIAKALVDSISTRWNKIREKMGKALVEKDDESMDIFKNFFTNFINNCRIINYSRYLPILNYYADLFSNENKVSVTNEIIDELDNSFALVLERIESKGKSGSCDDILAVLEDIILAPAVEEEQSVIEKVKEEVEEDVEKIFVSECQHYLEDAQKALVGLQKNPDDRHLLNEIETAMHAIRSSAHLLNKSSISEMAVTIEEAAEIFGKSSIAIPVNLNDTLSKSIGGLNELITNENKDVTDSINAIRDILDNIVIEDVSSEEAEEIEKEESAIEEKPLFADDESDEDMLEIFQEEANEFIALIKDSNAILKDKPTNAKALDQLDYAAHSLKQAAMMLGFREIAQITDSLENLTDAIKTKKVTNSSKIQDDVAQAVKLIEKLSKGETVKTAEIAKTINLFDFAEADESKVVETTLHETVEESEGEPKVNISSIFLGEAEDLLEKLNTDLLELEKIPESEPILTNLLRNLHTLKGSSKMAHFDNIGELAHKLEDYFDVYKQQNTEIKQQMLNPVFSAVDLIAEVIDTHKTGKDEKTIHFTSKMAEIDNKLFLFQNFDLGTDTKVKSTEKSSVIKSSAKKLKDDENVIRISTSYLDKLVNMATELLVNRTELVTYYEDLKKIVADIEIGKKQMYQAENLLEDVVEKDIFEENERNGKVRAERSGIDNVGLESNWKSVSLNFKEVSRKINTVNSRINKLSQEFEKNINRISNLTKELHSDILKARMVPIEQLFNRYPRLVRDMAHEQNKQIDLVIEDNEAELDRALVESLTDPILHIIRNAIDHGIELPKERTNVNKDKKGTIRLRATQDKNQIVIDIIDDGRGIDLEKVKNKVVKNKITTKTAINKLSEAEILDFIFLPEFSTREKTSDVSGRGLGLNVVYNQIQKLKGIIRVKTEKNVGTTFSIRVPLTLVVAQALMIKVQEQNIAIPVIAVQESSKFEMNQVLVDDDRKYLKVRGKLLPFIAINEILKFDGPKSDTSELTSALVLHDAGVSIALGVGGIEGRQEIVIKSLGDHLQNIEYIAGGTILGNGEVALILDYAAIVRFVESQYFGRVSEKMSIQPPQKVIEEKTKEIEKAKAAAASSIPARKKIEKKRITNRKPKVLIVDDSISVRNFVSSVLEKKGFSTYKSSDGASAMKRLNKGDIDIIITDLEMPKMTGFQLIETIRDDDKFNELPIVILSGKTGKDYRDKAMDIGASAFIMKPFKENDLLNVLGQFIEINQ
jgi:chemosensory pili system protein ChpA (sensor histidine kinase/response regulator)